MKFRNELKYKVNAFDLVLIREKLNAIIKHDANSGPDGKYMIKSLYFDNYTNKALREKLDGVDKREKFRIRYYNNDTSFIRLEKKSKVNDLCLKQSERISDEEVQKILNGDYSFLIQSDKELFKEFYAKITYQLLRPACIVAYEREGFVYSPGNVRITLDTDIRGSYNVKSFLSPDISLTQLYHTSILEVKWDEYLPEIIRNMVQLNKRKSTAFSKYAAVRI